MSLLIGKLLELWLVWVVYFCGGKLSNTANTVGTQTENPKKLVSHTRNEYEYVLNSVTQVWKKIFVLSSNLTHPYFWWCVDFRTLKWLVTQQLKWKVSAKMCFCIYILNNIFAKSPKKYIKMTHQWIHVRNIWRGKNCLHHEFVFTFLVGVIVKGL